MLTIDKIIDTFPHPTIQKITGRPCYEKLKPMHRHINANTASIQTTLGGGQHGYLGTTTEPGYYQTLTGAVFIPPFNPGAVAIIPQFATQQQARQLELAHKEAVRTYREFINVTGAIKQQLIGCIEETYLLGIRDAVLGFMAVSPRQMLEYLYREYGQISQRQVAENEERMRAPYNPQEPIEKLFAQVEQGIELAIDAENPFSLQQVLTIAYNLVQQTGVYTDDLRDWRRNIPRAQKNWPNFKLHFATDHRDYMEQQLAGQGGYNSANMATDDTYYDKTAEALSELAAATMADREAMANLAQGISTNNSTAAALTKLQEQITELARQVQNLSYNKEKPLPRNGPKQSNQKKKTACTYCWTHGLCFNTAHNSKTCSNKAAGHQDEATFADMMGGSLKNIAS